MDVVAGSTITSDAMIAAVEDALRQAAGDAQTPEVKMAPGEYTAEAYGFMAIAPLSVTLTVDETSIQDIEVDYNLESLAMSRGVEERMLPEMLEYQSVAVDSVSGCAAAMSTAEAMYENDPSSVNVLAIDKAGRFGGTSAFCGEPMAVNAPRFKEEFNNGEDYMDYDALVAAWDEYTEGDAKMDIVEYYLSNSGETIDWLYYEHGFEFNNPLTGFTAEDVYRCKYQYANIQNMEEGREYRVDVAHSMNDMVDSYFHNLIEDYEELGGEYMLEVEATEILYDEASNTVTGVLAQGSQGGVIGNTPIPELYDILDTIDEMGYLIKADTIEELAQQMGVPAENLTETFAAYEGYCESGVDEEFGKDASKLLPLGDGPYYAIKGYSATFSTVGGLDVDINFNVLKDDGETPIGGLYAVGNESGGVLYSDKKPYVTYGGAALGWAFTSGRLVGAKAVEYIAGK